MLDGLTILISIGLVLFVVVRAIRLDRERPWFDAAPEPASPPAGPPGTSVPPWRRRAPAPPRAAPR